MRFEGEDKSEKYGPVLDAALNAWMHGEALEKPVPSWFPFSMPNPSVGKKFIQNHLISYENDRNNAKNDYDDFVKNAINKKRPARLDKDVSFEVDDVFKSDSGSNDFARKLEQYDE